MWSGSLVFFPRAAVVGAPREIPERGDLPRRAVEKSNTRAAAPVAALNPAARNSFHICTGPPAALRVGMAWRLPSSGSPGPRSTRTTMFTLLLLDVSPLKPAQGPDMTQYLAVCAGLIGLVVFGGWAFKRLFARSLSSRASRRSLQVLDLLPLGGRQKLAVVRCYDRTFVVGLGDKELCLVAELDAQATPELAAASVEPLASAADQNAFQRLLQGARPRAPRGANPAPRRAAESALAPEGVLG